MTLPPPDTPLYSHPLPKIEEWLREQGCQQDPKQLNCWHVERPNWQAELRLDIDYIAVRYIDSGNGSEEDIKRAFKYSLSRQDIEDAVFAGP